MSSKITTEMIEKSYYQAKKLFEGKTSFESAIDYLELNTGMKRTSSGFYIDCFGLMMKGTVFNRNVNEEAINYYLNNISKDYGSLKLKSALFSLDQHIKQRELKTSGKVVGLRIIYDKYKDTINLTNADKEKTINRMVNTVQKIVSDSNGQKVQKNIKNKELKMSKIELKNYIHSLMDCQKNLCAHTGIEMVYDNDVSDKQLWCSLDRIDSEKHYEKGNLQLVCRFINMWKGATDDNEFCRLLNLVCTS